MAVQAQYPSNAFSTDFRGARFPRGNVVEELQMQMQVLQDRNLLAAYSHLGTNNNNGGTVFSSPQSDLTCNNGSASRKRTREQQQLSSTLLPIPNTSTAAFVPMSTKVMASPVEAATVSYHSHRRLAESALTSTSGRSAMISSWSSLANDLLSHLYQHNIEIDTLVRLQNERLRTGLEEARKRHCRALARAVEQGVARRLQEKEAELESAWRRNAELEEKVRQMSAESQVWFNLAKSNEALAAGLRAALDQLLLQGTVAPVDMGEGFGDSDTIAGAAVADDAQSCCFEEAKEGEKAASFGRRWACKSCGEEEVCVLLLPCRHLCLCKACESKVDTCPLCLSSKNASLHISAMP